MRVVQLIALYRREAASTLGIFFKCAGLLKAKCCTAETDVLYKYDWIQRLKYKPDDIFNESNDFIVLAQNYLQ